MPRSPSSTPAPSSAPTRAAYATTPRTASAAFTLCHVQPAVVPLTGQGSWRTAVVRYATTVSSALLVGGLPAGVRHRRLLADGVAAVLAVADLAVSRDERQRWLGAVIMLKLVGGTREHPRGLTSDGSGRRCALSARRRGGAPHRVASTLGACPEPSAR